MLLDNRTSQESSEESVQSVIDSVTNRSELVSQTSDHFDASLLETCARRLEACTVRILRAQLGSRFVGLRERLHNRAQARVSAEQRVDETSVARWLSGCALRVPQLRERATCVARELLGGSRVCRGSRLAVGDELFEQLALSAERESLCTGDTLSDQ